MLEWASPYAFLLLLLPLLMRGLPAYKHAQTAIKVPFFKRLQSMSGLALSHGATVSTTGLVPQLLLAIIWLCLVIAAAQPQWLSAPISETRSARDLMVAVDLSGSMANADFSLHADTGSTPRNSTTRNSTPRNSTTINRLSAVKRVLATLAKNRQHDRLGLIVFGDAAYLQAPFTEDHSTWLALLNETAIGLAGQSTVIGDAIGLAIKLFEQSQVENRVLILLTDGNDTGSRVPPIDAAKVAASYGIKIYCIAIGDPQSVGEEALDIATLTRVAQLTNGAFYQAIDPQQLADIQAQIGLLEPELFNTLRFQPRQNLHYIAVAVAALLAVLLASWRALCIRQRHV